MREQPSRRFRKSGSEDDDDNGESALERNGEAPDHVTGSVKTAIIDPVSDQRANGNVTTLNADELASVVSVTALCLVCRDSRSVDSVTNLKGC